MHQPQPTALVVEYDSWQRSFASDVLSAEGYTVLVASNGATGLRLAERHACDLILLDLALPELPGREVLRQLKGRRGTSAVPVILVGSTADDVGRAEGLLAKPLDAVQIVQEIRRVQACRSTTRSQPVPFGPRLASTDGPALRRRPLVLVASPDDQVIDQMTELTQRSGSVTCAARSAAGCLRVATAIGPDVVVLDPTLPRSLESHLRAHPVSAKARILHLSPAWAPSASRPAASGRPPAGLQWLRAVQAAAGLARLARDALT